MTVNNQITQLASQLESIVGFVPFTNENGEEISELIESILEEDEDVVDYKLEVIDAYTSCNYDNSVLCCCWTETDQSLHSYNILLERY